MPSGQPAMARMCCSNCEIEAPSSVQCPELCTRGAISLTSIFGPPSAGDHEHLDREHADIIQRVGDLLGDAAGLRGQRIGDRRRHARGLQDVVAVLVFGDVEAFDLAVGAARGDHRDFALERNEGFQDRRFGAEVLPDPVGIVALADDRLALAVIAEAAGLEHGGQADLARSRRAATAADDTSA